MLIDHKKIEITIFPTNTHYFRHALLQRSKYFQKWKRVVWQKRTPTQPSSSQKRFFVSGVARGSVQYSDIGNEEGEGERDWLALWGGYSR